MHPYGVEKVTLHPSTYTGSMGIPETLIRHRRVIVFLHLLLVLAMLPGVLKLRQDNSPEVFFAGDAISMQHYTFFCREFGGGKALRVALSGDGIWTATGLVWLEQLENKINSLPGIETAVGLTSFYRWNMLEWPPPNPAAFRLDVLEKGPPFFKGLISRDGITVTMLVVMARQSTEQEKELLQRVLELTRTPPKGMKVTLSSLPILHQAMDRSLMRMAVTLLPLLVLLAISFLWLVFRQITEVIVPFFYVSVCLAILFGIMGYVGVRLNLVNFILAPLVFVIALANAVHLSVRFRAERRQGKNKIHALEETFRAKRAAVLWAGLTTFVAFGSLVTAGLPPLRSVGLWSAIGIAIMLLLSFTLYPSALLLISRTTSQTIKGKRFASRLRFDTEHQLPVWRWALRHRTAVIGIASLLLLAGLIGVTRLRVEDNIGNYFSPGHPVRAQLETLQQRGIGVYAAELVLTYSNLSAPPAKESQLSQQGDPETEKSFLTPQAQQQLARLTESLRSYPSVYGAVGSGDIVEAGVDALLVEGKPDDNTRWMVLGMMQSGSESLKLLRAMVTADGKSARVTLLVPMHSFNHLQPVFEQAKKEAQKLFPETQTWITGQFPLILAAQQNLIKGLITSFSITVLCILLAFFFLMRRFGLTLLAAIPNLWPVVLVFGGMGWFRIPLDSASVMTAAVVLGLAVDDTFHLLVAYLDLLPRQGSVVAIENSYQRTAPASILTTITLVMGFSAVGFSDLLPVSRMGVLSAIAIAIAIVGDLVVLPTLLFKVKNSVK